MDVDAVNELLAQHGYEVVSVERLTTGASNHTFRVELADRVAALRWSPGAMDESEAITLADEARVLRAALRARVAVPEVLDEFVDDAGSVRGLMLEWVSGETMGGRIVRADTFASARTQLAHQCGRQLARIHSVPVGGLDLQASTAKDLVDATWERYQTFETPQPMIDFTARWLLDHLPDSDEPRLVHGDFRCGNLMVEPNDGLVSVLDWELAHIGDPMRDLGWMLNRSWRFGRVELEVGGFGTRDDLFAAYEAESGRTVDRDAVHFWEVFGSFWWSVTCLGMVQVYREGIDTSFERLAIGRRSSEAQADCAQLLIPGRVWVSSPEPDAAACPSAAEMLTAIADWLSGEHLTEPLDARTKYLARVAANALSIAAREADVGAVARAAEHERLKEIAGYTDDIEDLRWELIAGLRDGSLADDEQVHEHLRLTVADQLAIDQPTYQVFNA